MQADTSAFALSRGTGNRNFHVGRSANRQESPERCSAAVTENCALPAGERCRHPPPFLRKARMSYCVNATVDSM